MRCSFASFVLAAALSSAVLAQSPPPPQLMFNAAVSGDTAAVKALLAQGAPIDPRDATGRTPLLAAVEAGQDATAAALIDAGADINAQDGKKDSAWLQAGALGRTEMLRRMIPKGPNFAVRNRFGGNALIPACERAHVDAVKVLLTSRIDVDHVNDLGWTCLLEAVVLGDGGPRHAEVVRLVLAAGANPNIADKAGVTPLAHARRKGQREIADLIAKAGGR